MNKQLLLCGTRKGTPIKVLENGDHNKPKKVTNLRNTGINQYTKPGSVTLNASMDHLSVHNQELLGSYLADLVEADGCIICPKTFSKQAHIDICFCIADKPFAEFLQTLLGGNIVIGASKNFVKLKINQQHKLLRLCQLMNDFFRTPKIDVLHNLIKYFNEKYNANLMMKGLNTSPLCSNAWLAGFSDGDANFLLEISKPRSGRVYVRIQYRLRLAQIYAKCKSLQLECNSMYGICFAIAILFDCNLYSYTHQRALGHNKSLLKAYHSYSVVTTNIKSDHLVCSYFDNYPLFSSKRLNYLDWRCVYELRNFKQHYTPQGVAKISEIKARFNTNRTVFTWDHLSTFYAKTRE
uniref:Hypothetical LAGLIDADG homing endonuclease n=1 Tax=Chromochloris zofingiensis TaxID=31302 RepID=A0A076VI29_9CHLO|nr:hypothetical LAGLIDADG homing endonuclease [Chromochloris zofingiensis]AIK29129.1 hypothetical LAGLIDADG homing endonuclease [Chromochloris zofingiensis]